MTKRDIRRFWSKVDILRSGRMWGTNTFGRLATREGDARMEKCHEAATDAHGRKETYPPRSRLVFT